MRKTLSRLHRWLGLATAVFLFIAGLTGAIIAWDHELDGWLNPELFEAPVAGDALAATELARRVERDEPRLRVRYLPMHAEPGRTLLMWIEPRVDPTTGEPYELRYNQVAVDPSTGEIRGRRQYGAVSLSRAEIIPFLYRLHYTLHLPDVGALPTGKWLMGLVAIVWFLDGFIALVISFPSLRVWRRSFAFRFKQGAHKLTFDLHRSSGVWTWLLLSVVAFTSISMNLGREVVRPLVGAIAPITPLPFFDRKAARDRSEPRITREQVVELARSRAAELGIEAPLGGVLYNGSRRLYWAGFSKPGHEHGDFGLGNPRIYFDADSGEAVGELLPGRGSAGDLFLQAQFPLHSGRILGTAGRVTVTILGLVTALLSATGVLLWARKRRARALRAAATRESGDAPLRIPHRST